MPTKKSETAGDEVGQAQVQEAFDKAEEKGFHGTSPDPTPRDHYTVAGVLAGKPTPETDEQAKADALDPKKVL
jgi:hypothetical protein